MLSNTDYLEVEVTQELSRAQGLLRSDSKSWNVDGVEHACVRKMPHTLCAVLQELRPLIFDDNMIPKPWALQFMQNSKTTSLNSIDIPTGRLDIRFPDGGAEGLNAQAATLLSSASLAAVQLLPELGMRAETFAELVKTDVYIHVAFSRCQRSDFITTGHSSSKPFEEILILLPLTHGKPIAIWDQAQTCHRDGTPHCVIPDLLPNDFVVMIDTPYALLSTTVTEGGHVSHAFIAVRLSVTSGYIAKMKPSLPPFDVRPEEWLLSSTSQPPIRKCVVCHGMIRERRHGDLSGDRSRLDHWCSLPHCATCREDFPSGPYYICEFCVITRLGPCTLTEDLVNANQSFGNVVRRACLTYFVSGVGRVCLHQNAVRNDLVSTLFLLIDVRELQAAASFFRDFFVFGTWHQTFAPSSLIEIFDEKRNNELWSAFYKEFCSNAHCPRVQVICYAMQCALNTGPVLRARNTSLQTKSREIFFRGKMNNQFNVDGFEKCVLPRTLHAAAMAEGLFDQKSLQVMAIRVFKLLNGGKFKPSFACCCSVVDDHTPQNLGAQVLRCRGPSLDLSSDIGQEHLWRTSRLVNDAWAVENRDTLRDWQQRIRQVLSTTTFHFNKRVHVTIPKC